MSVSNGWEMSEKSLVRLVEWIVGEDLDRKEAAAIMFRDSPWANLVMEKGAKDATTTIKCWEKRDENHRRE